MDLVKVLESYRGKDRVIRLSTYVLMLLGGRGNTPLQAKFRKISAELGGCRVVLRLFDDLSMLMLNLSKGFGFRVSLWGAFWGGGVGGGGGEGGGAYYRQTDTHTHTRICARTREVLARPSSDKHDGSSETDYIYIYMQ